MKSVVICGSRRFKPEIRAFSGKLQKLGVLVYEPFLHSGQDEWKKLIPEYQKFVAMGLTHDHFYKMRMADVVFVYNKSGYIGNSTTLEMGYAVALGKPIYAFEEDGGELCRQVLFREIISLTAELVKMLR